MTTDTLDLVASKPTAHVMEQALIAADLSKLSVEQRLAFYNSVCNSLGLNPLTKPFAYINLNGRLTLYALRDCTDQLRKINHVNVEILERQRIDDLYVVRTRATLPSGRADESLGAVPLAGLKGEALANALMKGETKAKRRVTLSICGLGWLDETEVDSIPSAKPERFRGTTLAQLKAEEASAVLDVGTIETVDTGSGEITESPMVPVDALPPDNYRIEQVWKDNSGTKNGREWVLWKMKVSGDKTFSTFEVSVADLAEKCRENKGIAEIITETKRFGDQVVSIALKCDPDQPF